VRDDAYLPVDRCDLEGDIIGRGLLDNANDEERYTIRAG
jgi:hypothetical protein